MTIPRSSHVPRTVKASTLPAHNSPIDTLLIAIAVTRKWVDESAGRQVEWPMRLPRATPFQGRARAAPRGQSPRGSAIDMNTHGARPGRIPQLPACAANFSARAAKFPDYARKFPVPLRRHYAIVKPNLDKATDRCRLVRAW